MHTTRVALGEHASVWTPFDEPLALTRDCETGNLADAQVPPELLDKLQRQKQRREKRKKLQGQRPESRAEPEDIPAKKPKRGMDSIDREAKRARVLRVASELLTEVRQNLTLEEDASYLFHQRA
jgi:hypothetical protein